MANNISIMEALRRVSKTAQEYTLKNTPHIISEDVILTIPASSIVKADYETAIANNGIYYVKITDTATEEFNENNIYSVKFNEKEYECSYTYGSYIVDTDTMSIGITLNEDFAPTSLDDEVSPQSAVLGPEPPYCFIRLIDTTNITDIQLISKKVQRLDNLYLKRDLEVANSLTLGDRTGNIGKYSLASGIDVEASGISSHAEGGSTIASGDDSHAEGNSTTASNYGAHAEGCGSVSSGMYSHVEGYFNKASSNYQHVQGKYNIEDTANKYAHIVGNGSEDNKRSNAHTLDWKGNAWYAGDVQANNVPYVASEKVLLTVPAATITAKKTEIDNLTDDSEPVLIPVDSTLTYDPTKTYYLKYNNKQYSVSTNHGTFMIVGDDCLCGIVTQNGTTTLIIGKLDTTNITDMQLIEKDVKKLDNMYVPNDLRVSNSITVGGARQGEIGLFSSTFGSLCEASGQYSQALGSDTIASGECSHAEGSETTALGECSHAEGDNTTAVGDCSHAEGSGTQASGNCSHAEGGGTVASGSKSHAEGTSTAAPGDSSHSEGKYTGAPGNCSHAEGYNTKASSDYQHVQGKFNIEDAANKYAHIVGNGTSSSAKSNAHTLDWKGNGWYAGKLSQEGTPTEDKDLTTKKYVDDAIVQKDIVNNLKLVSGDNNTIKLMLGSKELSSITINGGTVEPIPNTYTIINNLSNATNSNSATSVKEGSSYSANISANNNYRITNVTVTMGGINITNTAYSNGRISISSVTGNISITVTTESITSGGDTSDLDGVLKDRLLVWHDEFDGSTLDTSKWRYATANSGGSEQQAYTVGRTENVRLENSNLVLEARKDGYVDKWTWSSGRIDTSGLAGFKYGRLEAKLRYDVVSGAFPAFWTIGTCAYYPTGENIHGVYKSKGTQWAQNGEIDMFEGRGTNTEIAQGGVYNQDDGKGNLSMTFGKKNIDASQYHVYAVEWTESTMISYIDGIETGRQNISDIKSWHRPMYIILNMAVGSTGGYPADDCTSIKMEVDWVRVYAPVGVTEKTEVQSITLSQNDLSFNVGDDPIDVYYTVNPSTAWDNNVNYESSDPNVATVYGSRITPVGVGACKITARATNGVTANINVTVAQNTNINSTSIALDKDTLEIYNGTSSTLIATVTPPNHTDSILWKSGDTNVATVSNGVVTGKNTGNCTITAYSSANSNVKAECSVRVKEAAQLTGHPTNGLTLQLDRNGMSSTSWTNAIDNTALQWKLAINNSTDIASYMKFDGDSFYWEGLNYKDHLTLGGFSNYYDFGESQTIILAGDFTNAANPILSNKAKLSQQNNTASLQGNAVSYADANGAKLGAINISTTEEGYNIDGCIALRYNKQSLRVDCDRMKFTDNTLTNKNVTLTSAFSQGSYPALLGNVSTAKIYFKVVLVYNRVLTDEEVQTAMTVIKTFLNS